MSGSKFLNDVAEAILDRYPEGLSDVVIIVPSKRARLFLLDHLRRRLGKPFWTPRFFTLPEFVEWLTGQTIATETELTVLLYRLYSEQAKIPESFTSFAKWSSIALKDFSDIDASLLEPGKVFSDLKVIKEIEGWSFNSQELSASQKSYMEFWTELGNLSERFYQAQLDTGYRSYNGLLRSIHEDQGVMKEKVSGEHIFIAGIAGFSNAEKKLCELLLPHTNIYYDSDHYYFDDPIHEAGHFARRIVRDVQSRWICTHMTDSAKNIVIHECPTVVSELMRTAEILRRMPEEELNDTCVVLCSESLINPFIATLSDIPVPVNIAVGIPLSQSTLAKWVGVVLEIADSKEYQVKGIYYADFLRMIQLTADIGLEQELCNRISNEITSRQIVRISSAVMKSFASSYSELGVIWNLFSPDLSPAQVLEGILAVVNVLPARDPALLTALEKLQKKLLRLKKILNENPILSDISSFRHLYEMLISREKLHYRGEPLTGMQVLGMIETRALDFGTVIFVGANEEDLPGNSIEQSFIPLELRVHHGLSLPSDRDAMFAYTFYRLLQRAQNVHFFYSSISSDFSGTEQSRFITQIEKELPEKNSNALFQRHQYRLEDFSTGVQFALNDAFAKSRLEELLENGISPSAINKFIACPLDFYYRYIVGLGEEQEVEEQMTSATFGSIIHFVLEKFYSTFIDSYPTTQDYLLLKSSLYQKLEEAMRSEYPYGNSNSGFNHLSISVAHAMLERMVDYEMELLKQGSETSRKVKAVEFGLKRVIDHKRYGLEKPLAIKGKGDRLDFVSGISYILDYKTGKVSERDTEVEEDISALFTKGDSAKQLQLLSYIYMYAAQGHLPENIRAGFYSFVNHSGGYLFLHKKEGGITTKNMNDFEEAFVNWVKSIFSMEKYEHNPDNAYCQYCR